MVLWICYYSGMMGSCKFSRIRRIICGRNTCSAISLYGLYRTASACRNLLFMAHTGILDEGPYYIKISHVQCVYEHTIQR